MFIFYLSTHQYDKGWRENFHTSIRVRYTHTSTMPHRLKGIISHMCGWCTAGVYPSNVNWWGITSIISICLYLLLSWLWCMCDTQLRCIHSVDGCKEKCIITSLDIDLLSFEYTDIAKMLKIVEDCVRFLTFIRSFLPTSVWLTIFKGNMSLRVRHTSEHVIAFVFLTWLTFFITYAESDSDSDSDMIYST